MAIRIEDYLATWVDDYRVIAGVLRPVAPAGASLHHIGSTAVPGLVAKDIIDLQLTVRALDDLGDAGLRAAGFEPVPRIVSDHCPVGLHLRPEDLAKRFFRHIGRPANLHVRVAGRFNQRYPLLCRDYLRAHPLVALAYGLLKRQIAARFPDDPDAYYDIKDPVFDIVMVGANAWAETSGWSLPAAD